MSKLKAAVIGVGGISNEHINGYIKNPDVELYAFCDINETQLKYMSEKYNIPAERCFADKDEMLKALPEIDIVSVCTWNAAHAECTIAALEHGVNVMLEKPMCVTTEEAVAIMRAEKKSGKVLSIGFQPRLDPNMQKVKEIVESGVLGDIYYIQTGGGRTRGIPAAAASGSAPHGRQWGR